MSRRTTKQRRAAERRRQRESMPLLMRSWVVETVYTPAVPGPERPTLADVVRSVYWSIATTRRYEIANRLWRRFGGTACAEL